MIRVFKKFIDLLDIKSLLPSASAGQVLTLDAQKKAEFKNLSASDVGADASGAATSAVSAHEGAFAHGNIAHSNRTALDNVTGTNTGDQDLSGLALKSNVLEKDNTATFTPTGNYQPATKKYVDDLMGGDAGEVVSVNGMSGAVVLGASDVSADPAGTAAAAITAHNADTTHKHLSQAQFDDLTGSWDMVVDFGALAVDGVYTPQASDYSPRKIWSAPGGQMLDLINMPMDVKVRVLEWSATLIKLPGQLVIASQPTVIALDAIPNPTSDPMGYYSDIANGGNNFYFILKGNQTDYIELLRPSVTQEFKIMLMNFLDFMYGQLSISKIGEFSVSNPILNEVLRYNGSKFVNSPQMAKFDQAPVDYTIDSTGQPNFGGLAWNIVSQAPTDIFGITGGSIGSGAFATFIDSYGNGFIFKAGSINGITSAEISISPMATIMVMEDNNSNFYIAASTDPSLVYGYGAANGTATLDAEQKLTFTQLPYHNHRAGIEDNPALIDNGGGLVTLQACDAFFFTDVTMEDVELQAIASTQIDLTAFYDQIVYVYARKSTGQWYATTTKYLAQDGYEYLLWGIAFLHSGTTHPHSQINTLLEHAELELIHYRLFETERHAKVSGFDQLTISSALNIQTNSAIVYSTTKRYTIPALVSGDTRVFTCLSDGTITSTTINSKFPCDGNGNPGFDEGIGSISTLTDTYWTICYIFKGIENEDHAYFILADNEFENADLAKAYGMPATIPAIIQAHAMYVGRVIIQKEDTTAASAICQLATTQTYQTATPVTAHESLSGVVGGKPGQRYHVDANTEALIKYLQDGYLDITLATAEPEAPTSGNIRLFGYLADGVLNIGIKKSNGNVIPLAIGGFDA